MNLEKSMSKNKTIRPGDFAQIVWTNEKPDYGHIVSVPQGPGDLLQIKLTDGTLLAINTNSPVFCRLEVKEKTATESSAAC
jgi:uncharacterized protein (AIM24 family)